ncbi:MAG: hypothetical protein Q3979_00445 [Actinomycetaceae bacterium]|nr:hypothetical protein [Actinomycetaceae bacterium]
MFFSFLSPGALKDVLPVIEGLTRGPGKSLVRASLLADAFLIVLGLVVARYQPGFFSTFLFIVACLLTWATAIFAVRTQLLASRIDRWREQGGVTVVEQPTADSEPSDSQDSPAGPFPLEAIVIDEDGRPYSSSSQRRPAGSGDEDRARLAAEREQAARQAAQPRDTWMPGLEAAQRAAIAAAGGLVNAPYLKGDLRITVVSGLISALAIPLAAFFSIIAFFVLLF